MLCNLCDRVCYSADGGDKRGLEVPLKRPNPDLPIFQRLSILLITLLKFDLFVSMMRDNTDSGSGYRVCMVMTERLVDIFRFQV